MPRSRIPIDENLFIKYYVEKKFSATTLGKILGVSRKTITKRLKELELLRVFKNKTLNFNNKEHLFFREIVDGIILGDGHIDNQGLIQIAQTNKHVSLLNDIAHMFSIINVETSFIKYKKRMNIKNGEVINTKANTRLQTRSYVEIKTERTRWYDKKRKKRIPKDIRLTPLSVALWFCGDGSYEKRGTLSFGTCNFSVSEVKFLCTKLNKLFGLETTYCTTGKGYNILIVGKLDDAFKLKNIIYKYIPKCFYYKLAHVRKSIYKKLSNDDVKKIRESTAKNIELAKFFKVSPSIISSVRRYKTYKEVK